LICGSDDGVPDWEELNDYVVVGKQDFIERKGHFAVGPYTHPVHLASPTKWSEQRLRIALFVTTWTGSATSPTKTMMQAGSYSK
jgi:hypothetical protein